MSYQDIIRLDVGVHDVALFQEIQCKEELFGVYPDSPNVQANILSKAFNDVPEVHALHQSLRSFQEGALQ